MSGDGAHGPLKTEIPEEVIAEAVAAVERHGHSEAGGASTTPAHPSDASTTPADAGEACPERSDADAERSRRAQRERGEPDRQHAEELDRLRAELAAEHDLRLRALADLDNFRKRVARERENAQRFGAEELLRDLLPALDNMDRALSALPEGPLATGVSMTRRQLEDTLKRHGLTPFQVEPGTPFDPHVHDAVHSVATADHPPGTVAAQQLRGYFLHDRLLRPASVVVASAPGDPNDG